MTDEDRVLGMLRRQDVRSKVHELVAEQSGCVARGQLDELGLTPALLRRCDPPLDLRSLRRDVYVLRSQPATPLARAWAAWLSLWPESQLVPRGVAVSHRTSLELYLDDARLPAWPPSMAGAHLLVPDDFVGRHRPGLRLHRTVVPIEIERRGRLPIASPLRTALDLARMLEPAEALVVLDGLIAAGMPPLALAHLVEQFSGFRGVEQARQLIRLARSGVDAPPESRLRWLMVQHRLPVPDVNLVITDELGRLMARGELGYERYLIWLEHDGYAVHSGRDAFRADRSRATWLQGRGWFVVRGTDEDIRNPRPLMGLLRHAIDTAPGRVLALPAGLSPEADAARAYVTGLWSPRPSSPEPVHLDTSIMTNAMGLSS